MKNVKLLYLLISLVLSGCISVKTIDVVTVVIVDSEIKPELLTSKKEVKELIKPR